MAPYLADNLVNEHYRPFMEYVERLLRRPDANRKAYALVEDDKKCGYQYVVLTISVRNANGFGFGYPWNLRHPAFEKNPPSPRLGRHLILRFIEEIIDKSKAAEGYSVSIRLDGALDRRFALAKVPDSPNCFEYGNNWLSIKGFTPDESLFGFTGALNSGKAKPRGCSSVGRRVATDKGHRRDRIFSAKIRGAKKGGRS